jgi:ferredoxin
VTVWLYIAGLVVVAGVSVTVLLFSITSVVEREWRAAGVCLGLGVVVVAPLVVLMLVGFPGRETVLGVVLGVGLVVGLVLVLPLGPTGGVRAVGDQRRVDERDAIFHRFYRLEPDTPEYDAYYADHPDQRIFDERVRALPPLASPGAKGFDARTAPFSHAIGDVVCRLNRDLDEESTSVADQRVEMDPEELSGRLKGLALHHGARLVGCTRLNPAYVYSHNARGPGEWGAPVALDHPYAMVFAVEMDHALVRLAPDPPALVESSTQYLESAKIALLVARTLHRLGWEARAHVDGNYRVMAVPIAVDAGLGELGRLGLLITPELGPRVRITVVTTTAPLAQDAPMSFGAAAFCEICLKCADGCPANAISKGAREVFAGVQKWQSRGDTCYRHWRKVGTDCALCLKVCPFSHPAGPAHDLVRWAIRRNGFTRRLALWGDDLCYGRRPTGKYPWPDWLDPRDD